MAVIDVILLGHSPRDYVTNIRTINNSSQSRSQGSYDRSRVRVSNAYVLKSMSCIQCHDNDAVH